ncbi:MAG: tetratricopeptide repeat protein [Polyangiaceae bacterium]
MYIARVLIALPLLAAASLGLAKPAYAQESAVESLKASAKATPLDARAALALGTGLLRAGHPLEAGQELRRGANLEAGRSGDVAVDLHYALARVAIAQRDFGQAMVQCRVVGSITGGAPLGHACAAEAHLLWKRASEALTESALAVAGGKKIGAAKLAEGHARELELKEPQAEAAFREAIAWKPDDVAAHVALGHLLVGLGKVDAGLVEIRAALQLDAHDPEALNALGHALPSGAEAISALENAVRERPTYKEALYRLAEIQLGFGRIPEARKAAFTAIKMDPQDTSLRVIAGKILLADGKPDEAINEAKAALTSIPNLAPAKLLIADAYAKKGEIDLAVENYQAAYGFDHDDPTPLVHASEACHAQGRETSAKAFGEKATRDFPTWAPGWVALGDALTADNETAGARTAYQTALKSKGPVDAAAVSRKMAALK